MNMAIRQFCQGTPVLRDLYRVARASYQRRRLSKSAGAYFTDRNQFLATWDSEDGKTVDLHTKDGLTISARRNHMDAAVLAEVFLENCYVAGLDLPDRPIIVDIGGYIGDFALYAVKRLKASKVVVCEPSPRNWSFLTKNIANKHCEDRIAAVNRAVTAGEDVFMNVNVPDRNQATVSAYGESTSERTRIPGISLASLVEDHGLKEIDLLKIDCEGGEYEILATTPSEVLHSIQNIVFECHEIDGFEAKLKGIKQRLRDEGYVLGARGSLVFASRPARRRLQTIDT